MKNAYSWTGTLTNQSKRHREENTDDGEGSMAWWPELSLM